MFAPDAQQQLCVTQAGEAAAQNGARRTGVGEIGVDFVGGTQHSGGVVDMKKCAG